MKTPFDHWPEFCIDAPQGRTMTVSLVVDPRREIEKGLWCDRCSLPAAIRVHLAIVRPSGDVEHFGVLHRCTTDGCEPEVEVQPG